MNIYCNSIFEQPLIDKLKKDIPESHTIQFRGSDEASNRACFEHADIVLGNPPIEWFSGKENKLIYWQLDSAGFDQYKGLQLDPDTKVANMGAWFGRPCSETIVGGILSLYRGLHRLTKLQQESEWVGHAIRKDLRLLYNEEVVILGAGTIGTVIKNILTGFGCHIHLFARTSPEANLRSKEELLAKLPHIDLVINTLPGTAIHFADHHFFKSMKAGSVYANVGRGSTTDETALIEALLSGHLDGAVLDVTEQEPLPSDHPLWKMPQVILTQHTGGGHKNEHVGKVDLFLTNIYALNTGCDIMDRIDISRGY
ncbi:D-2-hydroxyacid dehydrogenase [Dyadobacter tibetensis]|uniref:D-2-hydroxyacid dehydrogenase n=1 Tax=Dyadobacter tibetensis TaxID=1211851 RepID=UPI000470F887|nr:D-2-hydroxyacid dehydrogenase [Dyadobacter tibetensis]